MDITMRRVGVAQVREVHRIMQLAFEEDRGRLVPPSGALTETLADVRTAITGGGAFLAFAGHVAVGSARYRLFPRPCLRRENGRVAGVPWEGDRGRPHGGV